MTKPQAFYADNDSAAVPERQDDVLLQSRLENWRHLKITSRAAVMFGFDAKSSLTC